MNWIYNHRRIIFLILVIVLAVLAYPRMKDISPQDIVEYTPRSLSLAALCLVATYAIKTIVMVIPVNILYIAAGIIFPTGWAILLTIICLVIQMSIGYLTGKWMGEERIGELLSKKPQIALFLDGGKDHMLSMCFVSRILPFPSDLLNMFYGAVGMPYYKYIFISILGASPFMIPFVIAGNAIFTPLSPQFLLPFGISVVITITVFIIFRRLMKKRES